MENVIFICYNYYKTIISIGEKVMADKRVIIIGNGPAGISAALYTSRAGIPTTIIGKDLGSLNKAEKIENYYGLTEPVSGKELALIGINQAKRVGAEYIEAQTVGLSFDGENFGVQTSEGEYFAKCVIIATGSQRSAPKIKGLASFEGKGVSYCATCDGFFYRKKDVAVLGFTEYALHEADELSHIASSVTVITNGETETTSFPNHYKVIRTKIASFEGDEKLEAVRFMDGQEIKCDGVFVAYGVAGSVDFARKLGAETENNKIVVNEDMSSSIPGLFAAGDCTGGMMQVAKAVYEGARAGTSAVKFIRSK